MATVVIEDHVHDVLSRAALAAGEDVNQLASELLMMKLEEMASSELKLADELIVRLKRSVEELDRGVVGMTPEEVNAFFADWSKELDAR